MARAIHAQRPGSRVHAQASVEAIMAQVPARAGIHPTRVTGIKRFIMLEPPGNLPKVTRRQLVRVHVVARAVPSHAAGRLGPVRVGSRKRP